MKLIFQVIGGTPFLYRETESHFKSVEKTRGTEARDAKELGDCCDLSEYSNCHFVFTVASGNRKKKSKSRS